MCATGDRASYDDTIGSVEDSVVSTPRTAVVAVVHVPGRATIGCQLSGIQKPARTSEEAPDSFQTSMESAIVDMSSMQPWAHSHKRGHTMRFAPVIVTTNAPMLAPLLETAMYLQNCRMT
jgi:hypothetical protein